MYKFVLLALLATSVVGSVVRFDEEKPDPPPTKPDYDHVCIACNETFGLVRELVGWEIQNLTLVTYKEFVEVS